MIYASLRTVPRWHGPWTVPNYAALALAGGALWLNALAHLFGLASGILAALTAACVVAAGTLRWVSWGRLDRAAPRLTSGDATGLGRYGRVRLLDAPHTEENYLLREMGFVVARKHALKLRRFAGLAAFAVPLVLTLLAAAAAAASATWLASLLAVAAALSASLGVLVERWLFFAEAKHTVSLYYGAPAV
jgi:DMSO reductase anchor subunit